MGFLNKKYHLHFLHYTSYLEAENAWRRRSKRMHYDNLFVVLVERDGCCYEDLQTFDRLPFRSKVAIVHKPYPEIKCAFYIKGFENQDEVGFITDPQSKYGKYFYDQFDWPKFLNRGLDN